MSKENNMSAAPRFCEQSDGLIAERETNVASATVPSRAEWAVLVARNSELVAELELVNAERAKLLEHQRRLMDLLGTKSPEHIVHDLRNVLNERELFRALAFREDTNEPGVSE
jgi:lipoprotein NlpI